MKKIILILVIVFILIVAGYFLWQEFGIYEITDPEINSSSTTATLADQLKDCLPKSDMGSKKKCDELLKKINSFDDCVAAGLNIIKINPAQCQLPDGRSFTEQNIKTIEGIYSCLPHKNSNGPQTLECALGVKTGDGKYYGLDMSNVSTTPLDIATGEKISVTGRIINIESTSEKYDIVGVIKVTNWKK